MTDNRGVNTNNCIIDICCVALGICCVFEGYTELCQLYVEEESKLGCMRFVFPDTRRKLIVVFGIDIFVEELRGKTIVLLSCDSWLMIIEDIRTDKYIICCCILIYKHFFCVYFGVGHTRIQDIDDQ